LQWQRKATLEIKRYSNASHSSLQLWALDCKLSQFLRKATLVFWAEIGLTECLGHSAWILLATILISFCLTLHLTHCCIDFLKPCQIQQSVRKNVVSSQHCY
jgi:hypothetical protein